MIYCSNCGKEVHEDAEACIHCGKPLGGSKRAWSISILMLLTIGTILIPLIGLVSGVIGIRRGHLAQGWGLFGGSLVMMAIYIGMGSQ